MQHLRATAMLLPGTTPEVCPVDSIVNSSSKKVPIDEVMLESLDPCVWKYVLTHEALAKLRLSVRSDVIRVWDINEVTYAGGYYYQVKVTVHGFGYKAALSKNKKTYNGLRHPTIKQTRILLFPFGLSTVASSLYRCDRQFSYRKGSRRSRQKMDFKEQGKKGKTPLSRNKDVLRAGKHMASHLRSRKVALSGQGLRPTGNKKVGGRNPMKCSNFRCHTARPPHRDLRGSRHINTCLEDGNGPCTLVCDPHMPSFLHKGSGRSCEASHG